MDKHAPKTVEALKTRLEEQLLRMKDLSLDAGSLKLENTIYDELGEENAKNIEIKKDAIKQTAGKIYDRRDNFCDSVYRKISEIEEDRSLVDETEKKDVQEELQQFDTHIALLKRLNASVNLEMIVIKAELARAKEEQHEVYELQTEQENAKEEITQLLSEVEKLEIDVTSSDKRKNQQDVLTIAPSPKRQFISDPIPPLNSPNCSDDEAHAIFQPVTRPERGQFFDFSNHANTSLATDNKPKFVFKRAVKQGSLFSDPNAISSGSK